MSSSVSSGIVGEDLLVRHPRRQPAEHVRDRNPHVADAKAAAAFAGLDRDDVVIVHTIEFY